MADTIANTVLPKGTWVDIYASTGIAVGTQIIVQNLTTSHVRVVTKASAPTNADGFNTIPPYLSAANEDGDSGAWAFSSQGGAINVREA